MCRCVSSHLTHYHSSKIFFHHVGGGIILLLHLLLTHHHLHMSSHITHHNFHPNVTCIPSYTQNYKYQVMGGWVLLNTNCHQATKAWLATPNNRQIVNLSWYLCGWGNVWLERENGYVIQASELHGCTFPGSSCCTPGQRQMETSSWVDLDGLFIACYRSH